MTSDPKDAERLTDEQHREWLGREVRHQWEMWAREQPYPKLSWTAPWDKLTEPEREVDRRIGDWLFRLGQRDGGYAMMMAKKAEIERLTQERDEAIASARHARRQADLDIERAANTIQKLIEERDEARRSAEVLRERVATVDAERKRQREMLGDPRKGVHLPPADWGPPQNAAIHPSADDVERARELRAKLVTMLDGEPYGHRWDEEIAAALTAARREERQLRALDEAVIAAARNLVVLFPPPTGSASPVAKLRDALAARDAWEEGHEKSRQE